MAEPGNSWLRPSGTGSLLAIHVQPGAARSGLAGLHGGALKVRVAAPAVEGAANAALVAFLARWLHLSRREVTIERGDKSRHKAVWVALPPGEIERRLNEDLA